MGIAAVARAGWTQAVPDVTSSLSSPYIGPIFSRPCFSPFAHKKLPRLDIRASSSLMYFSALMSTSAMLA